MIVDKVGGVGPAYEPRKNESVSKPSSTAGRADSVIISEEATRAAEGARLTKLIQSVEPNDRAEKIKEVKERLAKGEYNNLTDETLNQIADRISRSFLG